MIAVILILIAALCWIAYCGYAWSWGPFHKLHDLRTAGLPGNAAAYSVENMKQIENSPLAGKRIVFLGSSVTYGASSMGVSFADFITARNGAVIVKEAVSGTTLVDDGFNSYIARLKRLDRDMPVDMFVCQLSTNDATQNKPLGSIAADENYDTSTIAGAIEYIISCAKDAWNCPVVFYTSPRYDSEKYADMVTLLGKIADKWEITVIDMWNDSAFNAITDEQRALYMADSIHPTRAGYLEWWTPYMEQVLYEVNR
jgi:Lysophospholipase L1 and related esterases